MPLTPADVRNKQFSTTRLRPGYDEEEVDAFLDEVEVELDRLIQENEELRSKLAECLRGGKTAVSALSSPLADPEPGMLAPEPMMPEPEPRPGRRASSATRRSGTARPWVPWSSSGRSLSGGSTTCARSSASTAAGSRLTWRASSATWRRAPRTAVPSPRWPDRRPRS